MSVVVKLLLVVLLGGSGAALKYFWPSCPDGSVAIEVFEDDEVFDFDLVPLSEDK